MRFVSVRPTPDDKLRGVAPSVFIIMLDGAHNLRGWIWSRGGCSLNAQSLVGCRSVSRNEGRAALGGRSFRSHEETIHVVLDCHDSTVAIPTHPDVIALSVAVEGLEKKRSVAPKHGPSSRSVPLVNRGSATPAFSSFSLTSVVVYGAPFEVLLRWGNCAAD